MSLIDDLLGKVGAKYDDLNIEEQETLNSWIKALEESKVTTAKIREFVLTMKEGVEKDLSKEPTFKRIFIFKVENPKIIRLQARLRNYLLLEGFLGTPERAREQLEQAVAGLAPKKT